MAAGIRTVPAEDWPERVDGQLIGLSDGPLIP